MHDNWLVLIALSVSGLGTLGLMLSLLYLEPAEVSVSEIGTMADNSPVTIKGEVLNVDKRGNITLLTVVQPTEMAVVVFDEITDIPSCVIVRGKKSTYGGRNQVVASRISGC